MTNTDCNHVLPVVHTEFAEPDWAANHTAAQRAGDRAYAQAQAQGRPVEYCADIYHVTYAREMWLRGTPTTACACAFCQWLNFGSDGTTFRVPPPKGQKGGGRA